MPQTLSKILLFSALFAVSSAQAGLRESAAARQARVCAQELMKVGSRGLYLAFLEEKRVQPAFMRVLAKDPAYWSDKQVYPLFATSEVWRAALHSFSLEWAKREVARCAQSGACKEITVEGSALTPVRRYHPMPEEWWRKQELQSEVTALEIDGKKKFFRPFGRLDPYEVTEARKTLTASRLSELMGNQLIVRAEVAVVNGQIGMLIEHSVGETGFEAPLVGTMPVGELSERGKSLLQSMGFFSGNYDLHYANYATDADGNGQILDSGQAFHLGIVPARFNIAGDVLPEKYSQGFITSVERFDLRFIQAHFSDVLCEPELQGTFLRRQVILDDARFRKAILLP